MVGVHLGCWTAARSLPLSPLHLTGLRLVAALASRRESHLWLAVAACLLLGRLDPETFSASAGAAGLLLGRWAVRSGAARFYLATLLVIEADRAHHGGSLPERTAIAWRGYLAALLEWDILPVVDYDLVLRHLPPMEDDPAIAILRGHD